jgi:DNA-binding response OmpR family regulator
MGLLGWMTRAGGSLHNRLPAWQGRKGSVTVDNLLALIIEDDEDAAFIFAKALQAAGFESEIVRTGAKALMRLTGPAPSMVVLDLELPRVSGEVILYQLRADVRLDETCVIVATAYPDLARKLEGEADLVLLKPVGYSQLRDLAAVWKSRSRAAGSQGEGD